MKRKSLVAFAVLLSLCLTMVGCAGPFSAGTSKENATSVPAESERPSEASASEEPKPTEQEAAKNGSADEDNSNPITDVINLKTTTFNLDGISFTMVLVEGGTFTMGSNSRESNQAPEHEVTLSSYLIGETEVTQALWNAVMGSGGSSDEYPIASVTKPQCDTFVEKLNEMAHAAGIIPDDMNFHVPTEAQWEFASKGGNLSKGYTYSGSDVLSEVGWTSDDGSSVHKVKQKSPNELGLYDMSGNVYEWVADYAADYSSEAQTDPCNLTPSNNYIKRGGSFYYNDSYRFTSTYRYFYSSTDYTIGVRICLY